MKKKPVTFIFSLLLSVVFALSFTACGAKDVSRMELNETQLDMLVGEEYTLNLTIEPESAADRVTWKSEDPAVATVTNGTVKALKSGSTLIEATVKNGPNASCWVNVKEEWQAALSQIYELTNYTAQITEDLGVSADVQGTPVEMFARDISRTVKFDKASKILSEKEKTVDAEAGEAYDPEISMHYIKIEGNEAYLYGTDEYDKANARWGEDEPFSGSTDLEESLAQTAAGLAFSYLHSGGYMNDDQAYCELKEINGKSTYDAQSQKYTITGLKTNFNFSGISGGSLSEPLDATVEITMENKRIKSYKLVLSGSCRYQDLIGGYGPDTREGESQMPEYVDLSGVITATLAYDNATVTVPADDQAKIDVLKTTRPVKKAFEASYKGNVNYTLTGETNSGSMSAKYAVAGGNGAYCMETGAGVAPRYLSLSKGTEYAYYEAIEYEKEENAVWIKTPDDSYFLRSTAISYILDKPFFFGDKNDPEHGVLDSMSLTYYQFAAAGNNTYTATFVDGDREWNSDTDGYDYTFADCLVTVTLDSQGRLASVEFDYGEKDGAIFENATFTFNDYGTTQVTIPQEVVDSAKEKIPYDDSAVYQALNKINQNAESVTINHTITDNNNASGNLTEVLEIDAVNGTKKSVYNGETRYERLVNGDDSCYNYYYYPTEENQWYCTVNGTYSDYEEALSSIVQFYVDISYGYSFAGTGYGRSLRDFYYMFEKSGNAYTADLYYDQDHAPCTVTIEIDGQGRITLLKLELKEEDSVWKVEQYTFSYGSTTVIIPQEALDVQPPQQ